MINLSQRIREQKYARLLLEVGVNLQAGQKLIIEAEPYHWEFLNVVAEEAYKMGASYVLIEANHPGLMKARIQYGAEEDLNQLVSWTDKKYRSLISEGWARLKFFGPTDPDAMALLDNDKLGIIQKAHSISTKPVLDAGGSGKVTWSVGVLPTPAWAAKVFGCEPTAEAEERLWCDIVKILNLDSDDPSAYWRQKCDLLKKRCEVLSGLNLAEIRFTGPGTDLVVKCIAGSRWMGGGIPIASDEGKVFMPNLPTEECFTTPNRRGTEGRMQVVRPVDVMGVTVTGAWFEFEDGKVISYGAATNKSALDDFFAMCPNAGYLGEIALVDSTSPIYETGNIYHCILYDENACCHVALGSAYPVPVEGSSEMTDVEKMAEGINVSIVHMDFMIGGHDVDVMGYDGLGKEVPLIVDGKFVV